MATKYKLTKKILKKIVTFRNYSMFGPDEDANLLYGLFHDAYCTSNSGETYYDYSGNELIKSGEYALSYRYDKHPETTYDLLCEALEKLPKDIYKKAKKFGKENKGDIEGFTNEFWFNLTADKEIIQAKREEMEKLVKAWVPWVDAEVDKMADKEFDKMADEEFDKM